MDHEVPIRSPANLAQVLIEAKAAVASGQLKYNNFESSRMIIGQTSFDVVDPAGPYDDAMHYYFDCPACGAVYELSAETYHGSEGRWHRLR